MPHEPDGAAGSIGLPALTRRVVASQSLFTAGNTPTVGGFFNYFVSGYQPSALWLAVLQAAPEFFETAGLFARPLIARVASRKALWMVTVLVARLAALGVPWIAVRAGADWTTHEALLAILGCVAVWYVCQGIGYVAFLSWLSDLAPEQRWGRFFAARQTAHLLTSLLVYSVAIWGSVWVRNNLGPDQRTVFYVAAFTGGGLLTMLAILPMWRVPPREPRSSLHSRGWLQSLRVAVRDRHFRCLLGWSAHLALFQGMTQAVLTKYQIEVLKIPLEGFLVMNGLMLLLQAGLSLIAGRISDRTGDVRALQWGTLLVSTALIFPLLATPATWYLQFGAYVVWGLFGIVNLCSQTLALRLAPRSDNTIHLGLFRPLTGFVAALAGLAGGFWLDQLLAQEWSRELWGRTWTGFHLLFAISLVGRAFAATWLFAARIGSEQPVVRKFESGRDG